jgi:hypothetical protein
MSLMKRAGGNEKAGGTGCDGKDIFGAISVCQWHGLGKTSLI